MRTIKPVFLLIWGCTIAVSSAMAATVHVCMSAEKPGDGTAEAPFRTIQEAIRVLKPGDTCLIHSGIYRETISGIPSGTAGSRINIRPYGNGNVVISGCEPVRDWIQEEGDIYSARVEMRLNDGNQVFVDGSMAWEARWPNAGGTAPEYLLEFEQAIMGPGTTPDRITNADLPDLDWTGASVWVSSFRRWTCWTGRVIRQGPGYLEVENNADRAGNHVCKPNGVFYIYGCRAALDSENEWWYDRSEQRLFLWAPGGGNPEGRVEVKQRQVAIDLSGTSHVTLRGITLFGATILTDDRSEGLELDNLHVFYFHHSNLADRNYGAQGQSGIRLNGKNHLVRNCEIAYSSGNGLVLAGRGMQVINNHIHNCNYIGSYRAPLDFRLGGSGHLVSHNTIERAGRSCVNTFGFHDSILQYNDIKFAGYLTWDLGLTYGNGVDGGNSELRYNWLHNNVCQEHSYGLYFDHGCRNLILHHNVIWNVQRAGIINNQFANYLLYYHNTVSDAKSGYRSVWNAAQEKDLYGCRIVNTLSTGEFHVEGKGLYKSHNLWSTDGILDKKYPGPYSGAIDSGKWIEGLDREVRGAGPDIGAYEAGGTMWTVGHDFKNPPVHIETNRVKFAYRNLLKNPDWYMKDTIGWVLTGSSVPISDRHDQWVTNGLTMMGSCGIRMGPAESSVEQSVTGLKPNSTYELMGMFRVEAGGSACLAVTQGATEERSEVVTDTGTGWQRRLLRFMTGSRPDSVRVSALCLPGGSGFVYVDNMGLQLISPDSEGIVPSFD